MFSCNFFMELLNHSCYTVADLGGGWGGCIPPTSLKVTILAEKSASVSNNSAPSPPPTYTYLIRRKISLNFGEDLFFFFFFFWRPPEFGRKKRLNFRFRPKNHTQFWWRHPNFWGFVLQIPPTKIFWIRHCCYKAPISTIIKQAAHAFAKR